MTQGFESDPVGSAAGWEVGYYPGLNGAGATTQLGVIDTDASPRDGGSRCVRWRHEPGSGRGGLARRWGTLPSGTGILRVSYDFKVVVTNKDLSPKKVVAFHEGRGSQEGIFGELKSHCQMGYVPVRTWLGNQTYLLAGLMAHNLLRELQMRTSAPSRRRCSVTCSSTFA